MNNAFDTQDVTANKTLAIIISVIPILFFLPLVSPDMKKSAYLMHTANTSVIVFGAGLLTSIVTSIFSSFGFIGLIISGVLGGILGLVVIALFVVNIINTVQANGKYLPLLDKVVFFK